MATYVKVPPPRQLTQNETLDSLDHWKSIFRSYFRRDSVFRQFLASEFTWDPQRNHHGFTDEENGMSAQEKSDALVDFLNSLAGFLPHSYLTSKIQSTNSLKDCWDIIEEHYNVNVTAETFLDFESIKKGPEENYRQFYERLLQHSKLHLAPKNMKVGKIINSKDDEMSISLMNHVALQWLRKIDTQLIQIIKTEYSTELRANEQLAHLVPKIAPNIDSLLSRYSSSSISKISLDTTTVDDNDAEDVSENVRRIGFRDRGRGGNRFFRGGRSRGFNKRGGSYEHFCAGCFSLGKELNTFISFKHKPSECTRQEAVARLLQFDEENYPSENDVDFNDDGKNEFNETEPKVIEHLQNDLKYPVKDSSQQATQVPSNFVFTINLNHIPGDSHSSSHNIACSDQTSIQAKTESRFSDLTSLVRKIQNIESRRHLWSKDSVRKESSPMVSGFVNSTACTPTIDEGSEINCIDAAFAVKGNIDQVPTNCSATAAGKLNMTVTGQTLNNVVVTIPKDGALVKWDLSKCVVVDNLGVDVLIGEPGKIDNQIITKSNQRIIETKDVGGKFVKIPYFKKRDESRFICRAVVAETLFPGESVSLQVPPHLQNETQVALAPTRESECSFVTPRIVAVESNQTIKITNDSQAPVRLKKNAVIADITAMKLISCNKICTVSEDQSHLVRPAIFSKSEVNKSYTDQVKIDPDSQLDKEWNEKFRETCERFSDVINPNPGRYNNYYGNVDCTIDFCSTPPPSIKARLPNYSSEKLKLMADQMDKMEEMGVLARPENVGVVPAFVVPSLLVPKPEKGEWRLVSDFTPLNIHIRKFETISPGIEEAKRTIAKYRYNIEMDLSNYFWQGGMRKEDMQYLATPHPFKGLRVYTVEPQGLRNASEHSYEKLTRIYGDLRQADKMTCMADGLYVVGDTLQELHDTFIEILDRARKCGLTFKPKKIVIAPKDTVLFGWRKIGDGWRPMEHTISPLTKAEEPNTVKQLRSFIGSYKQITECVVDYAVLLSPLEKAAAGMESAERIEWTPELSNSFKIAKEALKDVKTIFIPKPTDKLEVFVDYSQDKKAVGGRMIIKRNEIDGTKKSLLAGYFSCKLNVFQKNWLPCEGEALGVKLICKHFSPYIRENQNTTTVYTDNLPTVHAWRRMKTGAFSTSARVASFLTGLSALTVELAHKPGKEMATSDYNSRHPNSCSYNRCKICQFSYKMEMIGDSVVYSVKSISANDVENGTVKMPHFQRAAWHKIQTQDDAHRMFISIVKDSKVPEKKRTKGYFTIIKRLHNLYRTGQVKIDFDGFVTVKHTDMAGNVYNAISVPTKFYPGLVNALHVKLNHPSKSQMQRLMSRHFYCAGQARIIEEITSACTICASLKELPKELFSQSTTENPIFAANFSADVIKKDGQLVFLCREKLSQFTFTRIIPDETADSLRDSIVAGVLDLIPETGATIQVDCAPGLQTLAAEARLDGSVLKKLGIIIDLGRVHNVNKNPIAENAIKEFHKERLRLNPAGGRINEIERSIITKNMNSRIRERGLTSKEMAFNRDQVTNEIKLSDDKALAKQQLTSRTKRHPSNNYESNTSFKVGDNVFLKSDKSKLRGREAYKITNLFQKNCEDWATIQKCETKFMSKEYQVKFSEIFLIPKTRNQFDTEEEANLSENEEVIKSPTEDINCEDDKMIEKEEVTKTPIKDLKHDGIDNIAQNTDNEFHHVKRPRRLAALKFKKKMKEILPCLKITPDTVEKSKKKETMKHGWNYEDWIKEIDDDEDEPYVISTNKTNFPTDYLELDTSIKDESRDLNKSQVVWSDLSTDPLADVEEFSPQTPFGRFLRNLDDLPYQHQQLQGHAPTRLLDMFPTADEEQQEMTWDNSTTPPALRQITNEDADDDLNLALVDTNLYPNDDDLVDNEDLTSVNSSSDDVFFDEGNLKVKDVKRFSRNNPLRRHAYPRTYDQYEESGENDGDDEYEGENDQLNEETQDDEEKGVYEKPRRNIPKVNYELFHKEGKKK